jgi:hypothetical protein
MTALRNFSIIPRPPHDFMCRGQRSIARRDAFNKILAIDNRPIGSLRDDQHPGRWLP